MNAYPKFNPPCVEKDFRSRGRSNSKASQSKVYPAQSTLIQQSRKRILDAQSPWLIEAILSPAKYTLFQLLGTVFLQLTGCPHAPESFALCAKIGAFGGIIVAVFCFSLFVIRNASLPPDTDTEQVDSEESLSRSALLLFHETLYSALASAVGSIAYSWSEVYRVELGMLAFAGSIGPILFLILSFSFVGIVWCFLWAHKKFLDWYTGYL